MSILSSLFCCFDTKDIETREGRLTSGHPRTSRTQSNIQTSLRKDPKSHHHTSSSKVSYTDDYEEEDLDDEDDDEDLDDDEEITPKRAHHTVSSATPSAKSHNKTTTAANGCSSHKPPLNSTKTNILPHKAKATAATAAVTAVSVKDSSSSHADGDIQSKSMTHTDSTSSTRDEVSGLKAQNVREITDRKDSLESSKDDETDADGDVIMPGADDPTPQPNASNSKDTVSEDHIPETAGASSTSTYDDDDDELYREEEMDESAPYGFDLTKILSDQVVAQSGWLLDDQPRALKGRKTLVLDLDETLVHSSFKYVRHCDFVIPVEIENQIHNVYVIKRPGVDEFLRRCGKLYEVVVFTASVARYGDPLLDILDTNHSVHQRLFRESCYNYQGNYIKNLSQLGRPMEDIIIIDNSPASYIFHPQHSVPVSSWFSDSHDCELSDLLPILEDLASTEVDDVRLVLDVNI